MKLALQWALVVGAVACSAGTDLGKPNNGTSSGSLATEAGTKEDAAPCEEDAECKSGVCFVGGNQSFCSVRCTSSDAVQTCKAPFSGTCNKQGLCKRD